MKTVTKFIPCLLSEEQKENGVNMLQDLQWRLEKDPEFLLQIITMMKCALMGTNQKPCNSFLCGEAHHLHTQRGKTS
jgi:hypothetical protein